MKNFLHSQLSGFIACMVLSLLMNSCATHHTYLSNAINVPALAEEGEAQVIAYGGTHHGEIQTSYALTEKSALMVNSFSNFRRNWLLEGAYGRMYKINPKFQFDIFGGFGYSRIFDNASQHDDFYRRRGLYTTQRTASIQSRLFAQPSITFRPSQEKMRLLFSVACRTSWAHFFRYYSYLKKYYHGGFAQGGVLTDEEFQLRNANALIFDPVLTIRTNYKRLNCSIQGGYSFTPGIFVPRSIDESGTIYPVYKRLHLRFGLVFSPGKRSKSP